MGGGGNVQVIACLHDRTSVRSSEEIILLNLFDSAFPRMSDYFAAYLLTPLCPIQKLTNEWGFFVQCQDLKQTGVLRKIKPLPDLMVDYEKWAVMTADYVSHY